MLSKDFWTTGQHAKRILRFCDDIGVGAVQFGAAQKSCQCCGHVTFKDKYRVNVAPDTLEQLQKIVEYRKSLRSS